MKADSAGRREAARAAEPNDPVARAARQRAGAFVRVTWLMMMAAALAFVARYGADVPRWDDFDVVPVSIGEQPLTLDWLWSQHNEHRLPLPRLALLGAYRVFGGDFRAGMFCGVLGLGVAAAALVVAAAAVRGAPSYSDALFPIALLHWGHHATLLLSWQLQFVLSTILACALLIVITARSAWPSPWRTAIAGASLVLLALCGANGMALVPALACWFVALGIWQWSLATPRGRRSAVVVGAAIASVLLIVLLYGLGYRGLARHSTTQLSSTAQTAVEFLTLAAGPSVAGLWPGSGLAAVAVLALTGARLTRVAFVDRAERLRASGLLCFLAAMVSLAASIGWGRAATIRHAGLADRYVILAAPLLCAVSFAWQIYGGAAASRWVPLALAVMTGLLLWPNSRAGLEHGRAVRAATHALQRDVAAGIAPYKLVRRYTPFLFPRQETLAAHLEMLHRHGIGEFALLHDDPPFREIPVPTTADRTAGVRSSDAGVLLVDARSQLFFTLAPARSVAGIRLRDSLVERGDRFARFRLSWTPDASGFTAERQYTDWLRPIGRDRTTTIWIDDRVKQLRIEPDDEPAQYEILELTLLVPDEPAT